MKFEGENDVKPWLFWGGKITSERAEAKEKTKAKNRSKRLKKLIGGLIKLQPGESTETENGDETGKGDGIDDRTSETATGKPLATNPSVLFWSLSSFIGVWLIRERLIFVYMPLSALSLLV